MRFELLEPSRDAQERMLQRALTAIGPPPVSLTAEWIALLRTRPVTNSALLLAAAAAIVVVVVPWGLLGLLTSA